MEPRRDEPVVIRPEVDLDASTSGPELREPLRRALEAGHGHIVIDLGRVRFLDSTAMGALLWVRQEAGVRGARLRLAHVSPEIQRFLRIAGLAPLFEGIGDE